MLGFEPSNGAPRFRFFLKPGVMWVWVGGGMMALGGLLAAWPPRRRLRRRAGAPEPEVVLAAAEV